MRGLAGIMDKPRRIIFLAMYAMDTVDRGSAVRIHNVQQALAGMAEVRYIHGENGERRRRIRRLRKAVKLDYGFL